MTPVEVVAWTDAVINICIAAMFVALCAGGLVFLAAMAVTLVASYRSEYRDNEAFRRRMRGER